MMKKIFVTGAAGFIGAECCRLLLNNGHSVVGLDNFDPYYSPLLKKYRINELKTHPLFIFIEGDLRDKKLIDDLFSQHSFSHVINLAAKAGIRNSIEHPEEYIQTNVVGVLNILEAMKAFEVKKLIHASSSSLYSGHQLPFKEDISIDHLLNPYATSKRSSELLAYTYHHLYQIEVTVLRFFSVYGPAGRPDMSILKFIHNIESNLPIDIYGDGFQGRDFIYIQDIVSGIYKALSKIQGYNIINLGRGHNPRSINEVINILKKITGKEAYITYHQSHPADLTQTMADINKAQEMLSWTPRFTIEEGLQLTVDWYRNNRQLYQSLQ